MRLKKNILGEFLKEKRMKASLSQGDVANKLGYSTPQFISNWERGVSMPPINTLKKLGQLYKISADDLFEVTLAARVDEVKAELRRKFDEAR
ncbi:helix-turn-helix domain-containing protein [uncultured Bdellovibrio sp.]|uniref:helix-turn-helix domain-containing protein n=1 Tax=Bdellovibrio sp. HCB-162 TaxID=3394234 RepID=UPI0025E2CC97|nr:helix-turn-helix transcriptional regulator [uncultured Bdellovibrio sp.]